MWDCFEISWKHLSRKKQFSFVLFVFLSTKTYSNSFNFHINAICICIAFSVREISWTQTTKRCSFIFNFFNKPLHFHFSAIIIFNVFYFIFLHLWFSFLWVSILFEFRSCCCSELYFEAVTTQFILKKIEIIVAYVMCFVCNSKRLRILVCFVKSYFDFQFGFRTRCVLFRRFCCFL